MCTLLYSVPTTNDKTLKGFIIVYDKLHESLYEGIKGMTFPQMLCSIQVYINGINSDKSEEEFKRR